MITTEFKRIWLVRAHDRLTLSELAKVFYPDDPLELGRVKVRFAIGQVEADRMWSRKERKARGKNKVLRRVRPTS